MVTRKVCNAIGDDVAVALGRLSSVKIKLPERASMEARIPASPLRLVSAVLVVGVLLISFTSLLSLILCINRTRRTLGCPICSSGNVDAAAISDTGTFLVCSEQSTPI